MHSALSVYAHSLPLYLCGGSGPKAVPSRRLLTKLDEQDSSGRNHLLAVGRHALEVARVCGVQVANPQPRAIVGGPEGDSPGLLDHGRVIFEPANGGRWVPRDFAVQFSRLPQGRGDVVHGFIQSQVRICEHRVQGAGESSRQLESTSKHPQASPLCPRTTERLDASGGDRQDMKLPIYQIINHRACRLEGNLLLTIV